MSRPLKIVVGGYIIGYPLGGMTWHHLNYLLGLQELGHEVTFLEDSGEYLLPYNPTNWTCDADSSYGRRYLEDTFRHYRLPLRYCYYSQFENRHYGMSEQELAGALQEADLFLCVSGITPLRGERPRPRKTMVIDTDPVFTQIRMTHDASFLEYYRQFDAAATFGKLIGRPDCPVPTNGLRWIGTNQPVALSHWKVEPCRSRAFTTIGKWEHSADRHVEYNGRRYRSSKGVEWIKLKELPSRVPWEMTLGMAGMPRETSASFEASGWKFVDPEQASMSCPTMQEFIRDSAGEFTVAKEIYAEMPSGWFSDRASIFLASGRPVVTQDSGFDRWMPTGEGLFSFRNIDEAASALNEIARDYERHSQAARRVAEECLGAKKVLKQLLDAVL